MVSELAIEELEALERDGVKVSPRDAIRLNAFGLKLERNAETGDWCACRRAVKVGELVFREPTLAHEGWLAEVKRFFDFDEPTTFFLMHAYALTREAEELPVWADVEKIRGAVATFAGAAGKLSRRQMMAAIEFVTLGSAAADYERAPDAEASEQADATDDGTPCAAVAGLFRNARLCGFAVPIDEARRMTRAEFLEAMEAHRVRMGYGRTAEEKKNAAAARFYAVLDEIRENAKAAHNG